MIPLIEVLTEAAETMRNADGCLTACLGGAELSEERRQTAEINRLGLQRLANKLEGIVIGLQAAGQDAEAEFHRTMRSLSSGGNRG